ncbi:hypothetical protein EC973_005039 [Apophysomyces ossiformis]|uniref:Pentacotripeptide-repeat region of PRORP domain-containing protein n=1 Tax=Apophysomyces ossiformis TaxID=679940 RepID=A0A8H7ES98_9FUNG|nr:hypothetical protein EC973_005039 [Apophysomyces ossiformis]
MLPRSCARSLKLATASWRTANRYTVLNRTLQQQPISNIFLCPVSSKRFLNNACLTHNVPTKGKNTIEKLKQAIHRRDLKQARCHLESVMQTGDIVSNTLTRSVLRKLLLMARNGTKQSDLEFITRVLRFMETRLGMSLEHYEYHALMYAYGVQKQPENACRVLKSMQEKGLDPNVYTYNTLIGCFKRANDLDRSLILFEEMKRKGVERDVGTYNTLIHQLSYNGKVDEACNLYREMTDDRITADAFTFSTLLKMCTKESLVDFGEDICRQIESCKVDIATVNAMLVFKAYLAKDLNSVLDLYHSLPTKYGYIRPDITTFNILIDSCLKFNNHAMALRMFQDMEKRKLRPDQVTYGTLLDAEAKSGNLSGALSLFRDMVARKIQPTGRILNSLANIASSAQADAKAIVDAVYLIEQHTAKGLELDTKAYNALLNGLAKNGFSARAQHLYDTVFRYSGKADIFTYTSLTLAYINDHRLEDAMDIYYTLRNHHQSHQTSNPSIRLDTRFYTTIINALADPDYDLYRPQLEEGYTVSGNGASDNTSSPMLAALALFNDMRQLHILPNAHTYTTILNACGKHKDSYVLEQIHNHIKMDIYFDPDIAVYNALMDAYNRVGDGDTVLRIWDTLLLNPSPETAIDSATISIVLDSCGFNGFHYRARMIWKMLKQMEIPLNGNNYNSYIECLCRSNGRKGWDEARRVALEEMIQPGGGNGARTRDARHPLLEEKTVNILISFARQKRFSSEEIADLEAWKINLFPENM